MDADWIFDTAASHHFCCDKNLFTKYTPLKGEHLKVAVEGVKCPIEGKDMIKLKFGQCIVNFEEVIYSPKLQRNLISCPKMNKNRATLNHEYGKVKVSDSSQIFF